MTESLRQNSAPRIFFDEPVAMVLQGSDVILHARALNLSSGGIYVCTCDPLPQGAVAELLFYLPEGQPIRARATVVRAAKGSSWPPRTRRSRATPRPWASASCARVHPARCFFVTTTCRAVAGKSRVEALERLRHWPDAQGRQVEGRTAPGRAGLRAGRGAGPPGRPAEPGARLLHRGHRPGPGDRRAQARRGLRSAGPAVDGRLVHRPGQQAERVPGRGDPELPQHSRGGRRGDAASWLRLLEGLHPDRRARADPLRALQAGAWRGAEGATHGAAAGGACAVRACARARSREPSWADESGSPSASPEATTTSEQGTTNATFDVPETVDTYVGQSVQVRKNADGLQNSDLANFRWNVTQVNAESLNGLDVSVPLPMDDAPGLRSLTGRSNMPTVVDGGVLYDFDEVDGIQTKRTLNLWPQDRPLPVDVTAEFTLDGEKVSAQDIVGKGGLVTATYTIVNQSVKTQDVKFENVQGEDDTEEDEGAACCEDGQYSL